MEGLMWGIQDRRGVCSGLRMKADFAYQEIEGNADRRAPRMAGFFIRMACHEALEIRLRLGADAGRGELRCPPGTVGGEVELQVSTTRRIGEEKLRDIPFPKALGESAGLSARAADGGSIPCGQEPEARGVRRNGEAHRRIQRAPIPVRGHAENGQVKFTPVERAVGSEKSHGRIRSVSGSI